MQPRRPAIAVGVGGTAFLVATVAGLEVIGADFPSLLYVLPIALATALVAIVVSYLATGRGLAPPAVGTLAGVAAFGYAVLFQLAVRSAVAATRRTLQVEVIALLAALAALGVAAGVWSDESA